MIFNMIYNSKIRHTQLKKPGNEWRKLNLHISQLAQQALPGKPESLSPSPMTLLCKRGKIKFVIVWCVCGEEEEEEECEGESEEEGNVG
jgi:hypothetical protein